MKEPPHNIGFMAVDRIAADHGFSGWKRAFKGEASEGRFGPEKVLLLKPATFMNLSGESVRAALDFHKLAPTDVTVFHDELDLAPGRCRVKAGGGHAGTTGCVRSTPTLAPTPMRASGWASAIRATRMPWRAMCCTTSPRPTPIGWTT